MSSRSYADVPVFQKMSDARPVLAELVVSRPLYVHTHVILPSSLGTPPTTMLPDVIRRACGVCGADTNWAAEKPEGSSLGYVAVWLCMQCAQQTRFAVWCQFTMKGVQKGENEAAASGLLWSVQKIGQWEPWSIRPDPALEKELEKGDVTLYRRALMNMSTGYGLGALAYFRRVIENETGRLLELVRELAEAQGDTDLVAQLDDSKKSFNANDRLRLAANATPRSLKYGDVNPLKVLYERMSAGVHAGSEEECLETAEELRAIFEYVFRHVRDDVERRRELARVLTKRQAKKG